MVQKKPMAAKVLLQVEINVKKNFVEAFSDAFADKAEVLKKKFFKVAARGERFEIKWLYEFIIASDGCCLIGYNLATVGSRFVLGRIL